MADSSRDLTVRDYKNMYGRQGKVAEGVIGGYPAQTTDEYMNNEVKGTIQAAERAATPRPDLRKTDELKADGSKRIQKRSSLKR